MTDMHISIWMVSLINKTSDIEEWKIQEFWIKNNYIYNV